MRQSLSQMIGGWQKLADDEVLPEGSISLILYLADKLFASYEPEPHRPFVIRLEQWLNNVHDDRERRLLFSSLLHLFFAGPLEFESLHRSAKSEIEKWLLETCKLDLEASNLEADVSDAMNATWICPITDSLRINSFLKVNRMMGHEKRPDWRSLSAFGDIGKIKDYIKINHIERIVLLEDFVGSGSQSKDVVNFCCREFTEVKVLLCPLIVCPIGDDCFSVLESEHPNLTYKPVLLLPTSVFIGRSASVGEPYTFTELRRLIAAHESRMSAPYGYRDTGAMLTLFSNCPDNTISLYRDDDTQWSALFSRVWRPE